MIIFDLGSAMENTPILVVSKLNEDAEGEINPYYNFPADLRNSIVGEGIRKHQEGRVVCEQAMKLIVPKIRFSFPNVGIAMK